MNAILVVCVGNICRSPVAEALLKAQFPGKQIWSAGLSALVGEPADPLAQSVAAEHGLDLSEHRAQQLTSWMCRQADLILVMESGHRQELEQQHPLNRKIEMFTEQEQQIFEYHNGERIVRGDPLAIYRRLVVPLKKEGHDLDDLLRKLSRIESQETKKGKKSKIEVYQ